MNESKENLLDYLKKPSGYMTIVILIITIFATTYITSYYQAKKEITIQESQYNFLTRNEFDESDVNQHIHVYYDDKEIYNPHIIKITISNTGNQEITENDFKSDGFGIFFSENTVLYDISVISSIPESLEEEVSLKSEIKDNHLLIKPFLLNVGESFTLSLITNQDSEISYNFRIAGLSNTKKNSKIYISKSYILLFITFILLGIHIILMLRNDKERRLLALIQIIGIISAVISIVSLLFDNSLIEIGNSQQFIFK